ncbi:transposable element Tcb2 transposase [Trichonephila clavipes]|nr:transposable element Tcb2 transposase [Trichonephila clavipes]
MNASVWNGAAHEETGMQRNGNRSSLKTNPDSTSAVMTIVCMCERLNLAFVSKRNTAPTTSLMVVIAYSTRSPLVLIGGTMTVLRYVHDILQTHVLPLM